MDALSRIDTETETRAGRIKRLILDHPVASHPWFEHMRTGRVEHTPPQLLNLLLNYDAHATLLRRLLLEAATLMPEPAVGFILENVRNEYGNGDYARAHQGQLLDIVSILEREFGLSRDQEFKLTDGVRAYMEEVPGFYKPDPALHGDFAAIACISAGAVTATEVLALEEFKVLQQAFRPFDLAEHIWFDHVKIESEHAEESLDLIRYFLAVDPDGSTFNLIELGVGGVLLSNTSLYEGFLEAVSVKPLCLKGES